MDGLVGWWQRVARGTAGRKVVSEAMLTFLAGVALLAFGVVELWGGVARPVESRWVHVVPLAVGCAVMLAKRRRPVLALLAGTVVVAVDVWLGGSVAMVLVLLDLIYCAALVGGDRAVRRLRSGVAVAVAGFAVVGAIALGAPQGAVLAGLQAFAILGTPLWWGLAVRRQVELTELAEARAADLHRLAELREREVVAGERARMARDLHDAVAGNLSAIAIHAEAALSADAASSADRRALEAIRAASVVSLTEMRSMIMLLRAGADEATAPPRLRGEATALALADTTGASIEWSGSPVGQLPDLPAAVDQAAFRILQEALTNVTKHARDRRAEVTVEPGPDALRLTVTSSADRAGRVGAAEPPHRAGTTEPGTGLGLLTMRERAEALGGTLSAGREGRHWVVRARLPVGQGGG